jgi:hypothetical protein
MSGHVIFAGTYEIPNGAADDFLAANRDMSEFVKANEPSLVSRHTYISSHLSEVTTIMIHPDSQSLEFHLQVAASRIQGGVQIVRTKHMELYGNVSEALIERLQLVLESSGAWPTSVKRHLHGFPEWSQP